MDNVHLSKQNRLHRRILERQHNHQTSNALHEVPRNPRCSINSLRGRQNHILHFAQVLSDASVAPMVNGSFLHERDGDVNLGVDFPKPVDVAHDTGDISDAARVDLVPDPVQGDLESCGEAVAGSHGVDPATESDLQGDRGDVLADHPGELLLSRG